MGISLFALIYKFQASLYGRLRKGSQINFASSGRFPFGRLRAQRAGNKPKNSNKNKG